MVSIYLNGIMLPVLPSSLEVKREGNNSTYELANIGEVTLCKTPKPAKISLEGMFTKNYYPFITADYLEEPKSYVDKIEGWFLDKKVIRFVAAGVEVPVSMRMTIEDFSYSESGGEVGDISYSISLKEYRDFEIKKVEIQIAKPVSPSTPPSRPTEAPKAKTHTVKKGDCLWAIAKQYYGDGSKYPKIYELNKSLMDAKNKGTGNPKYTIYPNQVLTL